MRPTLVLLLGLALSGGACSSSPSAPTPDGPLAAITDGGIISCTIVQFHDAGQTATLCLEIPANGGEGLQQNCSQSAMGTPLDAGTVTFSADGGCSPTDSLGACRAVVNGQIQDQWYYGSGGNSLISVFGQDASTIMKLCSDMGDLYLAPP